MEGKLDDFPCIDYAIAEIQKLGHDTATLELKIMEDDTLYLFSFNPTFDGPRYTNEGDMIIRVGGAADLYYSKEGCRKLLIAVTR
jgi:hypothetical protein